MGAAASEDSASEDVVTTAELAKMLRWSAQTVRVAYRRARAREGKVVDPRDQERDAALLDVSPTPGGRLRWNLAAAARVLRAFGRAVPPSWGAAAGIVLVVAALR
jgi:hypothetical protein